MRLRTVMFQDIVEKLNAAFMDCRKKNNLNFEDSHEAGAFGKVMRPGLSEQSRSRGFLNSYEAKAFRTVTRQRLSEQS